jgi:hypothetical protein
MGRPADHRQHRVAGAVLLSRIVMIVGVFAVFRASDPAIYEAYVVSTYSIHLLRRSNNEPLS